MGTRGKNLKISVTGGMGFIASHLINKLLKTDPDVEIVNLDLLTYAASQDRLKDVEKDRRYTFVHGDICDPVMVARCIKDCDVIIHTAASSHVDRSIKDASEFLRTNITGTYVLLEEARKLEKPPRFIHLSTDEVMGSLPLHSAEEFTLESNYDPRSPYSASKAASDHLVSAYYHTFNLPTVIINASNNYGPFQHPEKFIPRAITNVLTDQPIPIYGEGNNIRDWIYVDDCASGILYVAGKAEAGSRYLIGGRRDRCKECGRPKRGMSNIGVASKIIRIMGKGKLKFVDDRLGHDERYTVDWSKTAHDLSWYPEVAFDDGLSKTIDWYKENEAWWRPLKEEAESFYSQK